MAQTNSEQTPQTGRQVTQLSEQLGTNPIPESLTVEVQQPVEEPALEKPKVINYLGNEYELDNYIKQLQYNIGPYISYLKLDKDQSRILRDSFNMFIGKLRAGEVAIDDTGAWVDYAGEMANTRKGFDPWGLVVRLANMGLSNMTPYQAPPEPEKTPVLPEFTFNSGRGYLFSEEDPLVTPGFSDLSWDDLKNILKTFFAIDSENLNNSLIYTLWGKYYSNSFEQLPILTTILAINDELNKDSSEPSAMLKYYLSRLGYDINSIWPKKTTSTSSLESNTNDLYTSTGSETSTTSTNLNNTSSNSSQSFDSFVNSLTLGIDYNKVFLTFTPDKYWDIDLSVRDNVDKVEMFNTFTDYLYNMDTTTIELLGNFMGKYFNGEYDFRKNFPNEDEKKAAMFWAIYATLSKIAYSLTTFANKITNPIEYFNTFKTDTNSYYLMGIKDNLLRRFKWNTTEWGRNKMLELYNSSISKKKKGGTIVKAQHGINWGRILANHGLDINNLPFFKNTSYTYDPTSPLIEDSTNQGVTQDQVTPPQDNGGTPQDQGTPTPDNGGSTPPPSPVVDTVPNDWYTTLIEFTGNLSDLDNLNINKYDRSTSWKTWRDKRLGEGDVIFWKDNEYYSMPGTMAYTFKDNLKNYFSGSTVVANENQIPSEGNAKWMSSLLSSLNAFNKGLFTSLNNDANARLLKENTLPVLLTPQTYTYSPLTTNFSTQQLQRQQALNAERQLLLGADLQSDITLGLNARKSATLDRLNNELAILAATDSLLRTDMASNITNLNAYFKNLSELTNTNRRSIYDALLQRALIDAANRTKNTENVWGGVFDTVGNNLLSLFTDKIERQENIIREYWRRRGNDYIQQVWNAWHTKNKGTYNDFLNSSEYADAQSEVASMLRLLEDYVPSASAYSWRSKPLTPATTSSSGTSTEKKGGRLTYSILNKLRR